MSRLAVICAVMGPEKAREELLAYLLAKREDMDQVSLAQAKSLGLLLPFIG